MNLGCRQPMDHILDPPAGILNKTQKGKRSFTKLKAQDTWNRVFSLQQPSEKRLHTGGCGREMRPRPCVDPAFSLPGARPAKAKSQSLYIPATRQPGPFEYGLNHSRSQPGQRKVASWKQSYWAHQPGLALNGSHEL